MGMFDYINYSGYNYQTKSLENCLDKYKIEDGMLWIEESDSEWIENDSLFGGYFKHSNERWVVKDSFSGGVYFYRHLDKTYKVWEEYNAVFVNGKLVSIERVEKDE